MKADTLLLIEKLQRLSLFHRFAGNKVLGHLFLRKAQRLIELDREISNSVPKARISRALTPYPWEAQWGRIRASKDDAAYVDFLGLSRHAFKRLARACAPFMRGRVRGKVGRQYLLDYIDIVAAVLHFMHSTSQQKEMNYAFGVTQTQFREALKIGFPAVHAGLDTLPQAWVYWPTEEQREQFFRDLTAKSSGGGADMPADIDVKPYGWIDGTFLSIPDPSDPRVQRAYYSGKTKRCGVNCLFVFAPDGTIIWYNINQPGTMHDWPMARRLVRDFLRVDEFNPSGWGLLADVGFRTIDTKDIFLTLQAPGETGPKMSKRVSRWITRKRQAVEWGIKDFKRLFPRLKGCLPANKDTRNLMLEMCVLLYNFRLRYDEGNSQIATVYRDAAKRDDENEKYMEQLPGIDTSGVRKE